MKNYYHGIKEIQYIYINEWSDPELIYKGSNISWFHLEDALYSDFLESGGKDGDYDAFSDYVIANEYYVLEIAEYLLENKIA